MQAQITQGVPAGAGGREGESAPKEIIIKRNGYWWNKLEDVIYYAAQKAMIKGLVVKSMTGRVEVLVGGKKFMIKDFDDVYLTLWDIMEALGYDWITVNDFPFDGGVVFYKDGREVLSIWEEGEQDEKGDVITREIKVVLGE